MNTFRKTSPVESTGKPAEVSDFEQSSLGGGFMGRFGSMRKPKHWSIYPKGSAPDGKVFIQCDNRWGEIDVDSGILTMSAPHGFANNMSLAIDKVKGKAERVELDQDIVDQIVDARDRKRIPDRSDVVVIDDEPEGKGPWSDPDYADYVRESSGKLTKDAIEDSIPCDAKDGFLDVNEPDGSFGEHTWYVRFAPGSQPEAEDAAEAIEFALGRRTQVADFGRFVAVLVKPNREDVVGESSKRKFIITAITEWEEDDWIINGDASHEDPEDVRDAVNMEHEQKECGDWMEGLPFTCMAEDLDDALDQYNQKYCEYDYLKAIDADYEEG